MDLLTNEIKMYYNKDCFYCKDAKGKTLLNEVKNIVKQAYNQDIKLTFIDIDKEKIEVSHIPKFEFLNAEGKILSVINGLPVTPYADTNDEVFEYVVLDCLIGIEINTGDLLRKANTEKIIPTRIDKENSAMDKIKAHLNAGE